jgi:hypothetical protein
MGYPKDLKKKPPLGDSSIKITLNIIDEELPLHGQNLLQSQ